MRFTIFFSIAFSFLSCFNPSVLQEETFFFSMQRTACYGTCPQYTVSIYDNGKITYNGKLFVDKIGCFSSFISDKELGSIKDFLDQIDFLSLEKEYISSMTDIPSIITEMHVQGQTHKVIDRLEGPESLKKCYKLIDSVIESVSNWSDCTL